MTICSYKDHAGSFKLVLHAYLSSLFVCRFFLFWSLFHQDLSEILHHFRMVFRQLV